MDHIDLSLVADQITAPVAVLIATLVVVCTLAVLARRPPPEVPAAPDAPAPEEPTTPRAALVPPMDNRATSAAALRWRQMQTARMTEAYERGDIEAARRYAARIGARLIEEPTA